MPYINSSNPPDPHHPIVAAALAASRISPQDVVDGRPWTDGMSQSFGNLSKGAPRVTCSRQDVRVYFPATAEGVETVFYMNEDMDAGRATFWIHEIEFRGWEPPETVVAGLAGRTLEQIADVPGGEGLRILRAYLAPKGLALVLEPASPGGRA